MSFDKDPDADLLGYMAEQTRDAAFAMEAFGEFYARHCAYLFGVVNRAYGRKLGGEGGAADLVQRTFERAYRWAGKHAGDSKALARLKGPTPEDARLRTRAWLGKIAENLFKDALRATKRSPVVELTDELLATVPSAEPDEDVDLSGLPPGARAVLAEELAALKPDDLEIITMSLPWYDPKSRQFALAPGEAEKLATSLGIEVDALRQRRYRAMKRLKDAVLARLEEQKSKGGTR